MRLKRRQWLPYRLEDVFQFFSDAHNLEQITPPWLHFKILDQSTDQIGRGTVFDYKIRIRGLPIKWRSLITQWNKGSDFVDVQIKGPYRVWHHTHRFFEYRNGTWIEDEIYYKPPVIPFISILIDAFVNRDVRVIFDYRQKTIEKIFKQKNN